MPDGASGRIGRSRKSQWFGKPTIPRGVPIPTRPNPSVGASAVTPKRIALPFLCQIDCREIPEEVTELPHDGELYFFANLDYYNGRGDKPMPRYASANWVGVVYVAEEKFVDADYNTDFKANHQASRITLDFRRPSADEPDNQLLGEPEHREWEDWDAPYTGWQLLLQMDSCETDGYHYNFMDWGVLDILISPADLRNRDFSRAAAIILST